jgi:hypothetical protein
MLPVVGLKITSLLALILKFSKTILFCACGAHQKLSCVTPFCLQLEHAFLEQ